MCQACGKPYLTTTNRRLVCELFWRAAVHAVADNREVKPDSRSQAWAGLLTRPSGRQLLREAGLAASIGVFATLVSLALRPYLAATNLAMVYLLGVVATALRCSRGVSVVTSFLNVAAFDFFCVPPYLTFRVSHYDYLFTFAGMLAVALVIGTQTARIRERTQAVLEREARTGIMYRLAERLAGEARIYEIARAAALFAQENLPERVIVFYPADGRISFARRSSDSLPLPTSEESVAQWVFDHGQKAGLGTDRPEAATALYLPLRGVRQVAGVMAVLPLRTPSLEREKVEFLEMFADQAALAMERTISQEAAEHARFQMQIEEMRSSLLSVVSHDLRTPLASITGAATTLRSQGDLLSVETRSELLDSIADEAERLGRLVANLLDITRLENGVELRREAYPLEEIVGSVLQRMDRQLRNRPVLTMLPENLPLLYVDDVLMGQLLINLLENANKYTPQGAEIELAAEAESDYVVLEVRDRGPGFAGRDERRLFDKFYRGDVKGGRGVGLGLAICRAIVEAHQGEIEAHNRAGGGAIFRVRIQAARQV